MKFIHSSDLQIGKVFGAFEPEVSSALQDARQQSVRKLGEAALKSGAYAILIAGDIYEKQQMAQQTVARATEAMRSFPTLQWHLMPGNHDRYQEGGLWDGLIRKSLPENVKLHTEAGAVHIADDDGKQVYLLPAPLRFIANPDDLTGYMDSTATPEGALRVGLAHGSVQGFGSNGEAKNYIDPSRPERAGLSYLALGDWHRQMRISDRCWYSGTPEPDQFKLAPEATSSLCNGGAALLIELKGTGAPAVTPIQTGQFEWHRIDKTITEDNQIDTLEIELRALNTNLSRILVDLRVVGTLSLAGRKKFEEHIVDSIGAALRGLRFDESTLVLNPTDQDLDEIDHAGFVRVAADRLRAMAADVSDAKKAHLASLALKRLYIEHLRIGAKG